MELEVLRPRCDNKQCTNTSFLKVTNKGRSYCWECRFRRKTGRPPSVTEKDHVYRRYVKHGPSDGCYQCYPSLIWSQENQPATLLGWLTEHMAIGDVDRVAYVEILYQNHIYMYVYRKADFDLSYTSETGRVNSIERLYRFVMYDGGSYSVIHYNGIGIMRTGLLYIPPPEIHPFLLLTGMRGFLELHNK